MAEAAPNTIAPFREIGSTGLNFQAGLAFEEFLPTLQGQQGVKVYQEMSLNSPVVGAILFIIEQMLAQIEWKIDPYSEEPADEEAKDFIDECLFQDMSFTWADTLSEILTFLIYGWSWMEVVYKIRAGLQPDTFKTNGRELGMASSKFNDRKIGWRKWSIRGQNTLAEWVFDESGGIRAMKQHIDWPHSADLVVPIQKSLLFRTKIVKNNPEGESIFRKAYRSWWYAKRLEESEAIGLERDLNGFPVLKPPESVSPFLWNTKDPVMSSALSHAEKFVQKLRRGEKEGAVLPFGWELELLSSGSRRNLDIGATIVRHETRIAMTTAMEFMFLGTGKIGSWALSTDKTAMFILALAGYVKRIEEVINRHAIPQLLALNGMDATKSPTLAHASLETPNLQELAQYLNALVTAGAVLFPDESLSRYLRGLAKFPEPEEGEEEPLPPVEGEPEELTAAKRKWLAKSMNELREMMRAQTNGHKNGGFFLTDETEKAFCPTGEGGGVDPSCSPSGGGAVPRETGGRAARAKASHVRMDKEKRAKAASHEATVATFTGGKDLPDNEPFDVIKGRHAIEVKAIIAGRNAKVTMHPNSLRRKVSYAHKNKLTAHTVVIDARGSTAAKYYYKKGVGSFRLSSMQRVKGEELRSLIK